jgi:hypothetical protein
MITLSFFNNPQHSVSPRQVLPAVEQTAPDLEPSLSVLAEDTYSPSAPPVNEEEAPLDVSALVEPDGIAPEDAPEEPSADEETEEPAAVAKPSKSKTGASIKQVKQALAQRDEALRAQNQQMLALQKAVAKADKKATMGLVVAITEGVVAIGGLGFLLLKHGKTLKTMKEGYDNLEPKITAFEQKIKRLSGGKLDLESLLNAEASADAVFPDIIATTVEGAKSIFSGGGPENSPQATVQGPLNFIEILLSPEDGEDLKSTLPNLLNSLGIEKPDKKAALLANAIPNLIQASNAALKDPKNQKNQKEAIKNFGSYCREHANDYQFSEEILAVLDDIVAKVNSMSLLTLAKLIPSLNPPAA